MKHEGLAILGLCLMCGGLWLAYPPAALIAAGVVLLVVGVNESAKRDGK